jgi:hypothetical protein
VRTVEGAESGEAEALAEAQGLAGGGHLCSARRELGKECKDGEQPHVTPLAHLHVLDVPARSGRWAGSRQEVGGDEHRMRWEWFGGR